MGAHTPRRRASTFRSAVSAAASAAFDPDDAADDPDPDADSRVPLAARFRALVSRYAPVLLGLALLEGYLRLVTLAMRFAGVTVAPLICALVLLTAALLVSPRLERALSALLRPAVDAVDAQIACVFIPYITAVPVSGLRPETRCARRPSLVSSDTSSPCASRATPRDSSPPPVDRPSVRERRPIRGRRRRPSRRRAPSRLLRRLRRRRLPPRLDRSRSRRAGRRRRRRSRRSATSRDISRACTCRRTSPRHPRTCARRARCIRCVVAFPLDGNAWARFPTITGGVAMALISAAMGALAGLGGDPAGGVRLYVAGAGATLLWFVPPAVLGLAFRVHARRRDVASNFAPVFAAVALAVPGGMFLGACVGRLAGLAPDLVLATIPKCTTTGLAVCMAERLGVDPSLVAAGCALSGTAGLAAGRATMDALRVRGATARGVATGVSSHAAGTAALAAGGKTKPRRSAESRSPRAACSPWYSWRRPRSEPRSSPSRGRRPRELWCREYPRR